MPKTRPSLLQSIRLTSSGVTLSLRIERGSTKDINEFLRESDLADLIDFTTPVIDRQYLSTNVQRLSAA
jgi:hypothetical protein